MVRSCTKKVSGNWNAMCLSTVDKDNYPDSRMVLFNNFRMKITSFSSLTIPPKGKDIENNEALVPYFLGQS